jgi:simple sugar transport system substrate-binding protein
MVQVLQAALNTKPDALVLCNYFPSGADPLIKKATAGGLPVFFTNTTTNADKDGVITSFGQPDELAGRQSGEEMYKLGVRHPMCFDNSPINPAVVARCTGFAKAFKAHGISAKTVNVPESHYGNNTAWLSDLQGALAADRKIDGILGLGQVMGPLMIKAVANAGRTGKVKLGTFDIDTNVVNEISSGQLAFSVWQQPYLQGYLPVLAAGQYLQHGFKYASPTIYTGPTFVTKKNIAVVKAAAAAGLA